MNHPMTFKASPALLRRAYSQFKTKTETINASLFLVAQSFEFSMTRIQSKFKARELRFIRSAFEKIRPKYIPETTRQDLFHTIKSHYTRPDNQGMDVEHFNELIEKIENLDEFHFATLIVLIWTDRISELT